jgi:membrane-associated phospholipid phosphatase
MKRIPPSQLFITTLAILLWVGGVYSRAWIHPYCADPQTPCSGLQVWWLDHFSIGVDVPGADLYSFYTQNLSGIVAILVPLIWWVSHYGFKKSPMRVARDWLFLIQATAWNGCANEIAHFISRRPRPYVYTNPGDLGLDPANYTSFYSGHTSFAALAWTFLWITLRRDDAPRWATHLIAFLGVAFVIATGTLRVLAARHFITDVAFGALAGTTIAILTNRLAWGSPSEI